MSKGGTEEGSVVTARMAGMTETEFTWKEVGCTPAPLVKSDSGLDVVTQGHEWELGQPEGLDLTSNL